MYKIMDKPLGTTMEYNVESLEKCELLINEMEEHDRKDGIYEPNWYVVLPM